jgi:hypothetical protein
MKPFCNLEELSSFLNPQTIVNPPKRLAVDFGVIENGLPSKTREQRTVEKGLKIMKPLTRIKKLSVRMLDTVVIQVMDILTVAFKPP